jgi:AraC family transcriptional regulator
MTEIALAAGFSHHSHMARCMRQVLGMSPRQIARSR